MRRWFLSYTSQDFALTQTLKGALQRREPDAHIFFAPENMRAGGLWQHQLAEEIAASTAFVLLIGESGVGQWQVIEYYEALDRRVKEANYPIILILSAKRAAPGLPFARQLHWVVTEDPASEATVGKLIDAASGPATRPSELWRYTRPYRGLEAMTEVNSDFFLGRERETIEVIDALIATKNKLPVLLGNSGVGKSSLAQAGVIAALKRQTWPQTAGNLGAWPQTFRNSRKWCFLTVRPGAEPIKALVEALLESWHFDAGDTTRIKRRNEWVQLLLDDNERTSLPDLLDETMRRYKELNQPEPPAYFLYIDQGEEIYVRTEARQRRRFSELLAHSLLDPRLRALMSLRSDFVGALQGDEPLFDIHRQINVPPLREAELTRVIREPAQQLLARFESDDLVGLITHHTLEDAAKDVGALPLLSYTLDDMWTAMVRRGGGLLRLAAVGFEHGGVLAERADAFLAQHPKAEQALKRVLTLRLATVRADGEPTRRRAFRSEFTDEEWQLVSELASEPYRLLVIATPEGGESYAEVAHEAILRRWNKLSDWIVQEREFLLWRSRFDFDRREWETAEKEHKLDALLQGRSLAQAQQWLESRPEALSTIDRNFIDLSMKRDFLIWKIDFDCRAHDWDQFSDRQSALDSYDLDYSTNELKPLNRLLVDNLLLKGIDLAEAEHWLQKYESDFSKSEREFIKSSQSSQRLSWRKVFILVICPWMPVGTLEAAKKLTLVGAVCSAVMSFCYLPNLASLSHLYMPILWAGLAIGTFWNSRVAAATAVGIGAAMALLIPLGDMQVGIVTPFHPDLLQAFLLSVNLSTIASTEVLLFLIQPGLWAGLRGATARHYLAVSKAMVD